MILSPSTLLAMARARITRRTAIRGLGAATLGSLLPRPLFAKTLLTQRTAAGTTFEPVATALGVESRVAAGHRADVLIGFGDPLLPGSQPAKPGDLDAAAAATQFGYGNDYTIFLPLPFGSSSSERGLLGVNHEKTEPILMWPGGVDRKRLDARQVGVEMASLGHSVLEIARGEDGRFAVVPDSRYARRTTAATPIEITGPAAGDERMKTKADPSGTLVLGTFADCAGGVTPWGTVLLAEENFHEFFVGDFHRGEHAGDRRRLGFDLEDETAYAWGFHHARFDVDQEPREPFRFGWIVELDPYDVHARPKKRTALGRFKHEGATVALDDDGRVVVYTGDDDRFEYLYKFVSHGRYDADDRSRNRELLDSGTLSVARFDEDGTGRWMPLVFGTNGLTPANGFHSQADVLLETRRAADLLGATPLDRPEDVEANPLTGNVYVALTNNGKRKASQVDAANPRAPNPHGHIVELVPPRGRNGGASHAALDFRFEILLLAGDPSDPTHRARYHAAVGDGSWLSCPDNLTFDRHGRMWIATDQGDSQQQNGIADGLFACDVEGESRGLTRPFYACPIGAEMCGPSFTPDGRTLFVAVQHPGDGDHPDRDAPSTYEDPATRWPDFDPSRPPRPAVVQITREDGGEIG
jgi:secreted PhoX family phosphatase